MFQNAKALQAMEKARALPGFGIISMFVERSTNIEFWTPLMFTYIENNEYLANKFYSFLHYPIQLGQKPLRHLERYPSQQKE
jgi:hypothetical protein